MMYPETMLTEIIQPWPDLFLFGAVLRSATKAPIGTGVDHNLMHTFLMTIQVILSRETVLSATRRNVAYERSAMSKFMLPIFNQSQSLYG